MAAKSILVSSLTRERKKRGKTFFPTGNCNLRVICLQRTPRTAQTPIEMAPRAGKHESNKDELETQLVHAVFSEKS